MKHLRDVTWQDYGISVHRKRELKAFCRQYPEKKQAITYTLNAVNYDGMPHGKGKGDALERQAIRNVQLKDDCALIEQAAIKASPEYFTEIIANATEGADYWTLRNKSGMPINANDFYGLCRLFYHYLDEVKK